MLIAKSVLTTPESKLRDAKNCQKVYHDAFDLGQYNTGIVTFQPPSSRTLEALNELASIAPLMIRDDGWRSAELNSYEVSRDFFNCLI